MRNRWILLSWALALAGVNAAPAQTPRHICRLLKADEIKTLLGPTVALANVTEDEPERSTCQYEDKDGSPVFILTVYWKGGKNKWNASSFAQTAGDKALARSEGVGIDSLAKAGAVKAGPVQGLGDAAYFSDLLPSLVLKGDVLLELHMAVLKDPETKFRPLAEKFAGPDLSVAVRTAIHRAMAERVVETRDCSTIRLASRSEDCHSRLLMSCPSVPSFRFRGSNT